MDIIKPIEKKLNKYLIKNISTFIPIIHYMKIIKYNKKLQEFNDISLYTYQLYFIKNIFDIKWVGENIDENFLFILEEFKINSLDKITFGKIITELKKEKEAFSINKSTYFSFKNFITKINLNLIYTNLIMLDLSENDFVKDNFNYDENKRIKIPGGIFPNLRILCADSNCIIPVSILINLTELILKPNNIHKILFFNDLHKSEIELQNLEKILITESSTYYYNIIDEKNNEKEEYKIKIKCTNLQILIINFLPLHPADEYDMSFLYDYFNFELLKNIFTEKQKNKDYPDKFFHYIKTKILDYNFGKKFNYFSLNINLYQKGVRYYNSYFTMEKYKNGLNDYLFSIVGGNDMFRWDIYSEEQEENENNKILKCYENSSSKDYYKQDINIDNLTKIKINNANVNELQKLFLIYKNNYKLQEISLQLYDDINDRNNFLENISYFRVLKKIIIYFRKEIDTEILIQFFKDISKLYFIETIGILYTGELSKKQKNIIKSLIKDIKIIKANDYHEYYKIVKNFNDDETEFEYYFDWDDFY